ncbi:MAG: hypothetical protein Q8K02_01465 [Flavobacterium sp.]|nr:hypothetical protein [Flavobacterium sp.]
MRYLFIIFIFFVSCNNDKNEVIESAIVGEELHENALNRNSFNPPSDHPIKAEFMLEDQKGLNEVDAIYRSSVPSSKNEPYYDNLRQIGFMLMIRNGLIEYGTKQQKLYYINEQLESSANLPNFNDFYLLLNSLKSEVSAKELTSYSDKFYTKNLALINETSWENEDIKTQKINELNEALRLFSIE